MSGCRGVSLLELTVAILVTTMLAGAGVILVDSSQRSSGAILRETRSNSSLRSAAEFLARDLKQTSAANLTITPLPDLNHSVTLRKPVGLTAGVITWGVYEKELGSDDATRARAGWSVRYIVSGVGTDRTLLRQVLDDTGVVRLERVLVRGLRGGSGSNPGFRLTATGTMWRLELGVERSQGSTASEGQALSFDIAIRN